MGIKTNEYLFQVERKRFEMIHSKILFAIVFVIASMSTTRSFAVIVTFAGGGDATGLKASADFELVNPTSLKITLTNDSVTPFGDADGSADMVLSSLNFALPSGVNISGGTVSLQGGSDLVTSQMGSWGSSATVYVLDDEYGYSNTGIGNSSSGSPIFSGITVSQVEDDLLTSVTSHTNGGNAVTTFNGAVGGVGGGLDFGLVAFGSSTFGNNDFIQDGVILDLTLDDDVNNLDFLSSGAYVEFGSDYAYVGGVIPEPSTFAILFVGSTLCVPMRRHRVQPNRRA